MILAGWVAGFLTAAPPCAQAILLDANRDGRVGPADLHYLVNHVRGGGPAPLQPCDANGDGLLDDLDLALLADQISGTRPLAAGVIGPEGGVIRAEGFTLQVPAGAMDREEALEISVGDAPADIPGATSRFYRITGLPAGLAAPLMVGLPSPAPAAGLLADYPPGVTEEEYVLFRSEGMGSMNVLRRTHYPEPIHHAEGTGAERTVWAGLDQAWGAAGLPVEFVAATRLVVDPAPILQHGMDGYESTHFKIMLEPWQWKDFYDHFGDGLGLLTQFEFAWNLVVSQFGMEWSAVPDKTMVYFVDTGGNIAQACMSKLNRYNDYVEINKTYLKTGLTSDLKLAIPHETMHLIQYQYDPRWLNSLRLIGDNWWEGYELGWLADATATYFEWLCDTERRIPNVVTVYIHEFFAGLHQNRSSMYRRYPKIDAAEADTRVGQHGYGLMPLIKHLADARGKKVVGDIYKAIYDHWTLFGWINPAEAVVGKVPSPPTPFSTFDWWNNAVYAYLHGDVLAVEPGYFLTASEGVARVALSPGVTVSHQAWIKLQDLSTTFFLIELGGAAADYPDTTRLTVSMLQWPDPKDLPRMPHARLQVFEYSTGNSFLRAVPATTDQDRPLVTLTGLGAIKGRGGKLLVAASNIRGEPPFTDQTEFLVDLRLGSAVDQTVSGGGETMTWRIEGLDNLWPYLILPPYNIWYTDMPPAGTMVTLTATVDPAVCDPGPVFPPELEISAFGQRASGNPCQGQKTVTLTAPFTWSDPYIIMAYWTPGGLATEVSLGPWILECSPGWGSSCP
jgi:hypothetical protein